jgi:hypothetical protein
VSPVETKVPVGKLYDPSLDLGMVLPFGGSTSTS